jgi:hypothetical protein
MAIDLTSDTAFDELLGHVGHHIDIARYGSDTVVWNVAIECCTCGVVLIDVDNPAMVEQVSSWSPLDPPDDGWDGTAPLA